MSMSQPSTSGGAVTLDQLIALSDEMAALVRAGVPLERGLIEAGRELRGRLGEITGDLGERLSQGESLPDALGQSKGAMPDVYRAVVEAGVRSGRLSQALEGMASIARNYNEARRAVGLALLYPLIVLSVAYTLSLVFILQIVPRFVGAFQTLGLAPLRSLTFLTQIGPYAIYWAPILPILLLLLVLKWVWAGRSIVLDEGGLSSFFNYFPYVGILIHDFRAANFAELLGLLVEHRMPLDEAVRLAGRASDDRSFRRATEAISEAIRSGNVTSTSAVMLSALPSMLGWMLTSGREQGDLAPALKHLARSYRRKAESRARMLRTALPTVLMLAIGAGAVAIYSLLLFVPLTTLWDELAMPLNQ